MITGFNIFHLTFRFIIYINVYIYPSVLHGVVFALLVIEIVCA